MVGSTRLHLSRPVNPLHYVLHHVPVLASLHIRRSHPTLGLCIWLTTSAWLPPRKTDWGETAPWRSGTTPSSPASISALFGGFKHRSSPPSRRISTRPVSPSRTCHKPRVLSCQRQLQGHRMLLHPRRPSCPLSGSRSRDSRTGWVDVMRRGLELISP